MYRDSNMSHTMLETPLTREVRMLKLLQLRRKLIVLLKRIGKVSIMPCSEYLVDEKLWKPARGEG
jgi:hypothetical protein